jgi:hypothetical protein
MSEPAAQIEAAQAEEQRAEITEVSRRVVIGG